jgi:uncharacterized membrane protein
MAELNDIKKYFRRVWVGYIILAVSGVIGTIAISNRYDTVLRNDYSELSRKSCVEKIEILKKYNNFVEQNIFILKEQNKTYNKTKNIKSIKINNFIIKKYKLSKILIPSVEECQKEL